VRVTSKDLKLHLVLAERELRYRGENGVRFHPMVVRATAAYPLGAPAEWTLDLARLEPALKKQLDEYEAKGHRGSSFKFREKKSAINPRNLALVAFAEDAAGKQTLQAAYLELEPERTVALHQPAETAVYVAAAAPAAPAPTRENPIVWSAAAAAPRRLKLSVAIAPGWHLYALQQGEGGPIPTRLAVAEGQAYVQDGEVEAPAPITRRDPNFGMDVGFYEHSAAFEMALRPAGAAPAGPSPLTVTARYQTCNDKLCLPPKTVKLQAEVAP
jgi:thiol:disulfide interchange protein DsbD